MKSFIITLALIPLFTRSEFYIDHITEGNKQYVIIEQGTNKIKIQVNPKDDADKQIETVCKAINCKGSK